MPDGFIFLGWLLWMGFCVWFWQRMATSKQTKVNESWLPLAERTGLTYYAGGGPSLLGAWHARDAPLVTGEYRGHPVEMRLASQSIDLYDGSTSVSYTVLTLQVSNRAEYALSAGERGFVARMFGKKKAAAETGSLDSAYRVEGRPPEFVRKASPLLEPLLWQRQTQGMNSSPFFWTSTPKGPSVVLNGSDLTWQQYDVVLDPGALNALLDELSDLAELIERQ